MVRVRCSASSLVGHGSSGAMERAGAERHDGYEDPEMRAVGKASENPRSRSPGFVQARPALQVPEVPRVLRKEAQARVQQPRQPFMFPLPHHQLLFSAIPTSVSSASGAPVRSSASVHTAERTSAGDGSGESGVSRDAMDSPSPNGANQAGGGRVEADSDSRAQRAASPGASASESAAARSAETAVQSGDEEQEASNSVHLTPEAVSESLLQRHHREAGDESRDEEQQEQLEMQGHRYRMSPHLPPPNAPAHCAIPRHEAQLVTLDTPPPPAAVVRPVSLLPTSSAGSGSLREQEDVHRGE